MLERFNQGVALPAGGGEPSARLVRVLYGKLGAGEAPAADWRDVVMIAASLGDVPLLRSLARGGSLDFRQIGLGLGLERGISSLHP